MSDSTQRNRSIVKPHNLLLVLLCSVVLPGCAKPKDSGENNADSSNLQTETEKFSYSMGFDIGRSLAQVKDNIDIKLVDKGIEDGLWGRQPLLSDQQREETKASVTRELQDNLIKARQELAKRNLDDGNRFLVANAVNPNVKTTASGLQYEILAEGKGDHPKPQDKLVVNYKAMLIDGTVFDSSYYRGQPASLPVPAVIPGWREGLQLMAPGSKYKFYIPARLAYGEHSPNQKVGPNSALIFETELVSIEATAQPAVASNQPTNKGPKKSR